jgi:hypothetical protein
VAVRARSRTPAVVPMYMSRVVRMLACPAMAETSVASSFQVNRAAVHSTCRRLCQVRIPDQQVYAAENIHNCRISHGRRLCERDTEGARTGA